jgi:hypothetical protein
MRSLAVGKIGVFAMNRHQKASLSNCGHLLIFLIVQDR